MTTSGLGYRDLLLGLFLECQSPLGVFLQEKVIFDFFGRGA